MKQLLSVVICSCWVNYRQLQIMSKKFVMSFFHVDGLKLDFISYVKRSYRNVVLYANIELKIWTNWHRSLTNADKGFISNENSWNFSHDIRKLSPWILDSDRHHYYLLNKKHWGFGQSKSESQQINRNYCSNNHKQDKTHSILREFTDAHLHLQWRPRHALRAS